MPPYRAVLMVTIVTAVVPGAVETTIISGCDHERLTIRTGTSVGELPNAEPENY
jgi:hypothetical protein